MTPGHTPAESNNLLGKAGNPTASAHGQAVDAGVRENSQTLGLGQGLPGASLASGSLLFSNYLEEGKKKGGKIKFQTWAGHPRFRQTEVQLPGRE